MISMSSNISAISNSPISQQFCETNQFDVNSDKKIHFIHIKQIHGPNLPLLQAMLKNKYETTFPIELLKRATVDSYERAARSQLKVAQAILEHSNCPVLDESLDCDITLDTIREKMKEEEYLEAKRHYEKIFPGGVLPEFDTLNNPQKEALCEYGAVQILHVLQKISAVYKSIHPEQLQVCENQAMSGDADEIKKSMSVREKEAIACAREAAVKHNHSTVLVVCGTLHNFENHCSTAGFSYEEIDCSFNYGIPENSLSFARVIDENLKSLVCIPNDVGFGNTLGICSETSWGMPWGTTVPFAWTPDGWIGKVPYDKRFKFVIMSQDGTVTWEKIEPPSSYNSNITYDGNRMLFSWDIPQKIIGTVKFG